MPRSRTAQQPDFFATLSGPNAAPGDDDDRALGDFLDEPPPEDFIQGLRDELNATLASVRTAEKAPQPWSNLDRMLLGEMRVHSVARWLPPPECKKLRAEFAIEMARIWQTIAGPGEDAENETPIQVPPAPKD